MIKRVERFFVKKISEFFGYSFLGIIFNNWNWPDFTEIKDMYMAGLMLLTLEIGVVGSLLIIYNIFAWIIKSDTIKNFLGKVLLTVIANASVEWIKECLAIK